MAFFDSEPLTEGQIKGLYGAGAFLGLTAGIWAGRNIKSTFKHMANIELLKMEEEYQKAARDVRYYSEKAATEGWAATAESKRFEGSQSVANAAAGYVGESAGTARLKKDTRAKNAERERLANRQLGLMSFERLHKAEAYAIEQKSIADQLRMKGKSAMLSSAINGLSKGVSFATSLVNYNNTFFRDPKVAEQSPAVNKADKNTFPQFSNFKIEQSPAEKAMADSVNDLVKQLSGSTNEFFNVSNTPIKYY